MKKQPKVWDVNAEGVLASTEGRLLQVDPLETKKAGKTVYVRPGPNTIHIAPPKLKEKEIARWNFETKLWEKHENHIGEKWYDGDKQVIVSEIGPIPDNYTKEPPPAPEPPKLTTAMKKERLIYSLKNRAIQKEMKRMAEANIQRELSRISKLSLTKLQEEYDER